MIDKLSIKNEMLMLDTKHREFYRELDEEERKKFSPYIIMRYAASVDGSAALQEWYLRATNERVNINFFDISATKHKEFQWLLCTTVSPGMGSQRHYWVAPKKKTDGNNKVCKVLQQLYPNLKDDEIKLLAKINTVDDVKKQARAFGWDDKRIKKEF